MPLRKEIKERRRKKERTKKKGRKKERRKKEIKKLLKRPCECGLAAGVQMIPSKSLNHGLKRPQTQVALYLKHLKPPTYSNDA